MAKTNPASTNTANELSVDVRSKTGKGASRRARREGRVPAVLYGHGTDPQHLEFNAHDFAAILRHSGTNAVLSPQDRGRQGTASRCPRSSPFIRSAGPSRTPT